MSNETTKESMLMRILFFVVVVSSFSSLLRLDHFRLGMLLTYSPRIFWILIALVFLFVFARKKSHRRLLITGVCVAMLLYDLPMVGLWNTDSAQRDNELTFLSFNIANEVEHASAIAEICDEMNVDLLSLQEVSPNERSKLTLALEEYEFFHADESAKFEHAEPRVFSSLIGIRKSLIEDRESIRVLTGITGYRTFAVEVKLKRRPSLQIVNVHTTKPFTIYYGISKFFSNAANKASRHRNEKEYLDQWLMKRQSIPTIVAGDFNAPANSYNVRFANLNHAHRQAGVGPHLTFPRAFPFIGIDHVLVSEQIETRSSTIVDAGFSDHRAQLTTIRIRPTNE